MGGNPTQVEKLTAVEAILRGNAEKRRMTPNGSFNRILLEKNECMKYSWPNHTGTGFAVEAEDEPFGRKIEKEFHNDAARKNQTLIYRVPKEDIGAANLMNLFEHGFREDGENLIQLINARTEKQILTVEALHEADEIILKVVGEICNFKITDRNGEVFGTAGNWLWATPFSALGLLKRVYSDWRDINAYGDLVCRLGVLYEDAAKAETPKA